MKIKYNLIMIGVISTIKINTIEKKKLIKNNDQKETDKKYILDEKNIAYKEYLFIFDQITQKASKDEQDLWDKYYEENRSANINYDKKLLILQKEKDQELEKYKNNKNKIKEILNKYTNLTIEIYKEYLNTIDKNIKEHKEKLADNMYLRNKNLLTAYINYLKKINEIEKNAL